MMSQYTTGKDDTNQTSTPAAKTVAPRPPDQALNCPRCDSANTKFCYYNNYSLTQPRYFCKTCRRYWTKGGALRNVPIGGSCRRNKKVKASRYCDDSKQGSSSEIGGLKFFNGFSPEMDFQLGGLTFPRVPANGIYNQPDISSAVTLDPSTAMMGFNFPSNGVFNQEMGAGNIASSIESLSYINQDLHWKLQQQRLAMFFGGHKENQIERPEPMMFQNLEVQKPVAGKEAENGDAVTEWFFGKSYAPTTTSNNNGTSNNNWSGVDLHHDQYSTLS